MAKVTKRDMFVEIANVLETEGTPEQVAFIDHEIALIDKRKNAGRKPTKAQLENAVLKDAIAESLPAEGATATEVAQAHEISVQKASQLLRQLVADGFVARVEGKGKEKTRFLPAE